MNWNKLIVGFSATALLMLAIPALGQQDSALVKAAKAKASEKKATHVYTNEDYPERPDLSPAASQGSTADSAEPDSGKNEAVAGSENKGNAAEKKAAVPANSKVAELQQELATAKQEQQQLRDKLAKLQEKIETDPDENHQRMYREMIDNQQVTLQEYDRKQQELKDKINAEEEKSKPQ